MSIFLNTTAKTYCIDDVCDRVYPHVNVGIIAGATPTTTIKTRTPTISPKSKSAIVNQPAPTKDTSDFCADTSIEDAHHWAILGNGQFNCLKKNIPNIDLSCSKNKISISDYCVHSPSIQCQENHVSFLSSSLFHVAKATNDFVCCKFGCFTDEELYTWMTYQPKCYNCLKPFFTKFWPGCVNPTFVNYTVNMIIYKDYTDISIGSKKSHCVNHYSFDNCCDKNGPVTLENKKFVDKFCACASYQDNSYVLLKSLYQLENVYRLFDNSTIILLY